MQTICKLLLKWLGWKVVAGPMPVKKGIIIGVPHTTIWDFVIAWLYYTSVGGRASTVIKKEFFFWPMGPLLRAMGGIPVDRSKGVSLVKQVIDEFNRRDELHLAITPEGTRKLTKRWKAGFHAIAKATGATIYLGFFDWGRKEIGWYETFDITDDAQADIRRMKAYYRQLGIAGKHPELFTTEE
ncbi:MAG: 1-acyl-sn-glycerol-3-phosphate acyltransferase [Bacteroidota bacterium]